MAIGVMGALTIASAIPQILNSLGLGGTNNDSVSRMPKRPKLSIQPATQELVGEARSRLNSELPGAGVTRNSQQTAMANMLSSVRRASTNPSDLLLAAAGGAAQEAAIGADMAVRQDAFTDQNKRDYMGALGVLADEQKEVFDYNQNMPFQLAMAERQARMIAENQMKSQRFTNMTSLLASLLSSDAGATGMNALLKSFSTNP